MCTPTPKPAGKDAQSTMSKTNGEGRNSGEKGSHLWMTPQAQQEAAEKKRREEAEWAAKCGPVVIKQKAQ